MANAEAAAGPQYAPDDPTLPKPWKGLIIESTGVTYYWNPETNVTQYEKPAGEVTPLPSGVAPPNSASQSATQHGQPAEYSQYSSQYMNHLPQQQGQFNSSMSGQVQHQQPSPIPTAGVPPVGTASQSAAQHGQPGEVSQYPSQYMNHLPQQGQYHSSVSGQVPHQQPLQIPPTGQQGSYPAQHHAHYGQGMHERGPQVGQALMQRQYGSQLGQQTDQHTAPQQGLHVARQPGQHPSELGQQTGQPNVPQQGSHGGQQPGQHLSEMVQRASQHQSPPMGQSKNHQLGPQHMNYASYQQSMSPHGQPNAQPQPPSQYMPQGPQFSYQQGSRNMGFDGNQQGRGGQGFHFNGNNEPPNMAAQRPHLAAIPVPRNQQDMRAGAFTHHHNTPPDSSLNAGAAHGMHSMFNHANPDQPMPNQSYMRTGPLMSGPTDLMNMPSAEAYCVQHEVTATGENVPPPYMTFEAAGFSPEILNELRSAGFASPTPIQAQTWPIARQHRDIVAIAKTGSGKTLGYLMPAFMHLKERRNNPRHGPTVLILSPTRELATQIQAEANKFGRSSRVVCACLYGGAQKGPQLEELRRGADIVVATPGRLNDVLETKHIDLGQVSLLVLDEADRMLDMGFEPQIRKVVNEMPPRRQTLMYTATWPKEVRNIAGDLLNDPVQVNIGSVDELAANKSITQYVEVVQYMEKQRRLEQILRTQERGSKVIIFCSTKRMCDELARNIRRNFPTAVIHGDKNQTERDYVLNQFRSGESPILIATDVAARGLDVKDIRVVINYDFPTGIEDYVHRIGRTGRAGNTGVAFTFLSDQDWKHAADLVKLLEGAEQPVPPQVRDMALRGPPQFGKDRGGMNNRFEPGPPMGGSRWDSGGRGGGMRDGGFNGGRDGGFNGGRDGGFNGGRDGGRGGMRDAGFRGGPRDGGFGGRGMRDGGSMNNRGGRSDFGGRGNRGGGRFGSPGGGYGGARPRDDYGSNDRFNSRDSFGRGRGRGRFESRRDGPGRSRGSSPDKVSTWDRSRSRSRSYSRSPRRSYSRSRSPRRSYSRSRSPRRSYSRSRSPRRSYDRSRGRSRSRSHDRPERPARRASGFDKLPEPALQKDIITPLVDAATGPQNITLGNNPIPGNENHEHGEKPIIPDGIDLSGQVGGGV